MKILKKSLNEQIYEILKEDIINHKINFGEILVNRNLQDRFNVSSTPIRDAILRLKEDGIIENITRNGAKIIDFDLQFALEVNQLLMTISLGAIEYSMKEKNIKFILKDLRNCITLQQENIDHNLYYFYDYLFHKTFFDYSDNKLLKDLFKKYALVNEILVRAFHKDSVSLKNRKLCIQDHEKIIEFVKNNDLDKILKTIKKHYISADEIFKKEL